MRNTIEEIRAVAYAGKYIYIYILMEFIIFLSLYVKENFL